MNGLEPTWIPGVLALAAGVLAAGWAVLTLRRSRSSDHTVDATIADLEEQAGHLIAQLRDLEEQKNRLAPDGFASEKARLEKLAAAAVRSRDEHLAQSAEAKRARRAEREKPERAARDAGPRSPRWVRVTAYLAGTGAVVGLLFALVSSESTARTEGQSITGGGPMGGGGAPMAGGGAPVAGGGAPMAGDAAAAPLRPDVQGLIARLEKNPNDIGALLEVSHLMLESHAGPEARGINDRVIELDPDNLEARVHSAVFAARDGDIKAAEGILDAVLLSDSRFAEAWFYKGKLAVSKRDTQGLLSAWRKFLEVGADRPEAEVVRSLLAQAEAQTKAGIDPLAAADGEEGALPPGHPAVDGAPPMAGGMPPMAGGMPPMAGGMPPFAGGSMGGGDGDTGELTERLAKNPNDLDALLRLGHIYMRSQRLAEAQELTTRALRIDPESPEARVHAAVIDSAGGGTEAALRGLNEVVKSHPDFAEAWFFRGMIGMRSGDSNLTQESWRKFVAVAPDGPQKDRIRGFLQGEGLQMPQ